MKCSIFNNIISLQSGQHVIYNALTQKFIACMTPEMLDNGALSIEKLDKYPDFLKQLKEIGALVDKDFDEVDSLRRIIESVDNDMSMWQLHINPTLDCNFKCWRKACHTCRIAPLCGGGCRQQAADHDGCIYAYTEEEKDAIVIDRFFSLIYAPE